MRISLFFGVFLRFPAFSCVFLCFSAFFSVFLVFFIIFMRFHVFFFKRVLPCLSVFFVGFKFSMGLVWNLDSSRFYSLAFLALACFS